MSRLMLPLVLVAAVAAGSASTALAANKATAANPKAAECARQWKAEKKHTQTRKAFLAACEKA